VGLEEREEDLSDFLRFVPESGRKGTIRKQVAVSFWLLICAHHAIGGSAVVICSPRVVEQWEGAMHEFVEEGAEGPRQLYTRYGHPSAPPRALGRVK